MIKIVLVGEVLKHRSFNGANKALPVLASSLHNAEFTNVIQLDLERPDLTMVDVLGAATDADIMIFAGCMTPQWPEIDQDTKAVFEYLQRLGRNVPILVGGYATKGVADIARITPWVTAFCDGEGEAAIVEIARAIARGTFDRDLPSLEGLCFLDQNGHFHLSTASRVNNFDAIEQNFGFVHVPTVHDMDIFRTQDGRQLKTAQLFTQRGCPWACGFCNKSTESNSVVRLSEESFRTQLRQLKQSGYEAVYLDVDTFTVNEKAARHEAEILQQEEFIWGSNTRIDKIDFNLMTHLVQHNCVYMFFGVEHTLPEVSLAVGKFNGSIQSQIKQAEAYPKQVERVFRDMSRAELPSSYFIILGLPKAELNDSRDKVVNYKPTTFEDDMNTIRFGLETCNPDFLNLNILRFMPGSAAADVKSHPAYSCVRPSGKQAITAGYFLPRAAKAFGYKVPKNHGIYRLCESVGRNQPTTTAMDAERVYDTVKSTMELINAKIAASGKPIKLFIDRDLLAVGLVERDQYGKYAIAPLKDFEGVF